MTITPRSLANTPYSDSASAVDAETVDPTPYFARYGNNVWAASQQYLAAVVAYASGPVIKKYLGVLAAADVYTASTTFVILESVRLDLGVGSQVHA